MVKNVHCEVTVIFDLWVIVHLWLREEVSAELEEIPSSRFWGISSPELDVWPRVIILTSNMWLLFTYTLCCYCYYEFNKRQKQAGRYESLSHQLWTSGCRVCAHHSSVLTGPYLCTQSGSGPMRGCFSLFLFFCTLIWCAHVWLLCVLRLIKGQRRAPLLTLKKSFSSFFWRNQNNLFF